MATVPAPTPQERIELATLHQGLLPVIDGCVRILSGDVSDSAFIRVLGGLPAEQVLAGAEGGASGYWPRVWALRGLLYAWDASATDALLAATRDEHWRVREMAAKVAADHRLLAALDAMRGLAQDENERVREAAQRATVRITQYRS